jgi:hypothetical protein
VHTGHTQNRGPRQVPTFAVPGLTVVRLLRARGAALRHIRTCWHFHQVARGLFMRAGVPACGVVFYASSAGACRAGDTRAKTIRGKPHVPLYMPLSCCCRTCHWIILHLCHGRHEHSTATAAPTKHHPDVRMSCVLIRCLQPARMWRWGAAAGCMQRHSKHAPSGASGS